MATAPPSSFSAGQAGLAMQGIGANPGMFFFNKQVPVIQLNADDAQKVVVSAEERTKIVEALRKMYETDPKNPAYAATQENVRRLYLMRQSRAAALISPPNR